VDAHQDTSGIPAARPVDPQAYRGSDPPDAGDAPWYRDPDLWARAVMSGVLVLAWVLTDLGPAALAAAMTVAGVSTVRARTRRDGTRWWTVLEVVLLVALTVATLLATRAVRPLPGAELAAQLVVGAAVGVAVAAGVAALSRRRAAPTAPPTAPPTAV